MNKRVVSKKVFEVLLKHLVDIEERKEQLLDKYYPDTTKERDEFVKLLNEYIAKIEYNVCNLEVVDNQELSCPFIFIGSIVELENLTDRWLEKYRIVSPYESGSDTSIDFASILSPLGKALLLREVMDKVTIENPIGQFTYAVRSISVPDEMLVFLCKEG